MKNRFFLVAAVAALGLGMFFASCSKDDDAPLPTCDCDMEYNSGYSESFNIKLSDPDDIEDEFTDANWEDEGKDLADDVKDGKVKDCKQVEDWLDDDFNPSDVSCKVD